MNHSAAINLLLDALDHGPSDVDSKLIITIAISTPVAIVLLCILIMICRVATTTTRWKQMPKGTEPDQAIGEHQDEFVDVDSADEQAGEPYVDEENIDVQLRDIGNTTRRACCHKMAAAFGNGHVNVSIDTAPGQRTVRWHE